MTPALPRHPATRQTRGHHTRPHNSRGAHADARRLTATLLATAACLLAVPAAQAADAAPKAAAGATASPAKKPAAAPAGKPATAQAKAAPAPSRQQLADQAKGLALAKQTVEQISAAQLDVAARVLTGTADCEFKQQVHVHPVNGVPGHFQVAFQNRRFTMVPQETQTGAVRLEDKQAGVVWLQIPAKSMLMDGKRGQRMVDSCQHAEQRIAVQAAADAGQSAAGNGLGITPAPTGQATATTNASTATTAGGSSSGSANANVITNAPTNVPVNAAGTAPGPAPAASR